MKTNWQTEKLGEICDVLDSQRKPVTRRDRITGEYPYYGATGIQDYVSDYIFDEKLILIGEDGAKWGVGENTAFVAEGKYWVNNHAHVIRPHRDKVLDNWIVYFLNVNDLSKHITRLTVQKLNQAKLRDIELPLPPVTEQKRIVKKLDEVFEKVATAKENAEKNLQNAKELFESYLQGVFANPGKDWEEKKIKEIGITQTGLTPKTAIKKYYGNFVPFITPADIDISGDGSIRYDSKGLSEEGLEVGRKIGKDSVLMVCIGATIGKVGFATQVISCNQQINTLTPSDEYDAKLFYYILSTKSFFNKVIKESSQATLPIINKGKWENLSISFPKSLSEQKAIVKKLDELLGETKKLEKIYTQKLDDLEELKKSVLKKAFEGEL